MATVSDFPFDPNVNPTWGDILDSTVSGFPGQTYTPVLDTGKVDSSIVINPLLVPQQIGAVWSNTVDTFMRVSWPAIVSVLVGGGGGGSTFLGLDDVDEATYSGKAGQLVRVNAIPDGLEFTANIPASQVLDGVTNGDGTKRFLTDSELEGTVETREPVETGVLTWGAPGLSVFDTDEITIEAGTGIQVTRTGLSAVRTDVTWTMQNLVINTISSRKGTWITVDNTGTPQQYTVEPAASVFDSEIFLGLVIHDGAVLGGVIPAPIVAADLGKLTRDAISAGGVLRVTGGGDVGEKSVFQSTRSLTNLFAPGINFVNDADNPNVSTAGAEDPVVFNLVFQDGTESVGDTSTFTKSYESSPGVLTALSGQQAVIHKIILLADGTDEVQYGNVVYSNFSAAKSSITDDLLSNPLNPLASALGVLLGVAVISNPASDWTVNSAEIVQFSGGGSGGGGGTVTPAFGDLTDVTFNSPSEGDVAYFDGTDTWVNGPPKAQFLFTFDGNVPPGVDVGPRAFVFADKFLPLNVRLDVKTAPTTTGVQVDVLKNGTTIFSGGAPVIGVGNFTVSKVPLTAAFVSGDEIRIDIDAGDVNWEDLTVSLQGSTVAG